MSTERIEIGPDFHAEPGPTPGHLHDVYTTRNLPERQRVHIGQLTKAAVDDWAEAREEAEYRKARF